MRNRAGNGAGRDQSGAPRLAASQLKRLRRIVDAAVGLAEKGGFDGVRLRDVAEESGVALGTLYRYFRSKEDILVFALSEQIDALAERMEARPAAGATPLGRVESFFSTATRALTRKPHFARAVLRAVVTGEPETTAQVAAFHMRVSALILAALRDEPAGEIPAGALEDPDDPRTATAFILQQVWFAALVGWLSGRGNARSVVDEVHRAASLLLEQRMPGA